MPTRSGDGFSFPIRKFDDGPGLFTNFKYLEQWLRRLGQGGATYAEIRVNANGQNNWAYGNIDWERDDAAVIYDPTGMIVGFHDIGGDTNSYIELSSTGIYYVTFNIDWDAMIDSANFAWANIQTQVMHTNDSGQQLTASGYISTLTVDADSNAIEYQGSVSQAFEITDTSQRIFCQSGPITESVTWSTEVNAKFLYGDENSVVSTGTGISFLKVA